MATLNIFVSFEFDKDYNLKKSFYKQAQDEEKTHHHIRDCSLEEAYPDELWRGRARRAIAECDVVVVLVGQDTHNAPGVIVETDIARSLGKPIIQVRPQKQTYRGLTRLEEPIPGRWQTINAKLDEIAAQGY